MGLTDMYFKVRTFSKNY